MIDTVNPLARPYTQVVLPLVYSDALSYLEALEKTRQKLNELIEYSEAILPQAKAYTDKEVKALEEREDIKLEQFRTEFRTEFDNLVDSIDTRFTELNKEVDDKLHKQDMKIEEIHQQIIEQISLIQNDIVRMYELWEEYQVIIDNKFRSMYQDLTRYIDEHIGTITQLYVINPLSGQLEDINIVLKQMFNAFDVYGLMAKEYDYLGLTAGEYDRLGLSALEYDFRARLKFFTRLYVSMRNPFTGLIDSVQNVIDRLVNLHRNALTSIEYDNAEFSADMYDGLELSAYDYDFNGKSYIYA